jgi:hypothetical protein
MGYIIAHYNDIGNSTFYHQQKTTLQHYKERHVLKIIKTVKQRLPRLGGTWLSVVAQYRVFGARP